MVSQIGPDDGNPNPPIDTSSTSDIDSSLLGVWHRYNSSWTLLAHNYVLVTDTSITIDLTVLAGVRDSNPQFSRVLIARNGQILYQPDSACVGCPNMYLYDFTLANSDSVLYLVFEETDARTNPTVSTSGVIILRHDTVSATTDLNLISDSLIGGWDLYDSTGATLVQRDYLVVTADSIVLTAGAMSITFKGYLDPVGTTGRTLVARNGQIWYDYHWDGQPDMYRWDYALSGANTMYMMQEESSAYTPPEAATPGVMILRK